MMKKVIAGLVKIVSLSALVFFILIIVYVYSPIILFKKTTCLYIQRHESFNTFLQDMTNKIPHTSAFIIKIYSKIYHIDYHLEAGEYCFSNRHSMASLLQKIARGERERHKFTIVDGWNYQDLISHLANEPLLNDTLLHNKVAIAAALNLPSDRLEGQFFPETYYYAYPDTAIDLLRQAHRLMQKKMQIFYDTSHENSYYKNAYELLIAPSIIEKESNIAEEQQLISSVIVNRLKKHMKLQMDPTVIYGLNDDYHGSLTRKNLKINTPYNTYLHLGLPPTPICMPSESALFAAAHPTPSLYYYYVAKYSGYHQFSKTLAEQNLAIKQYLLHQSIEGKNAEQQNNHK